MSIPNTSLDDEFTIREGGKPRLFDGHFSSLRRSRLTRVRGRRPSATRRLAYLATVLLPFETDGQRAGVST